MQEVTKEILKVFDDLERMQIKQKKNGVGEAARDACGYAFEPYDAFSTKPLEFTETALRLDIEGREMFAMLRTLNRHSPLFYKLSGEFEKILKLLGSCCITKAVLEKQENEPFELLQDLTIDRLREMTAFNFRKCSAAFMDSRACGKTNLDAFSLSVRWSALDKRLIATGEKIGRVWSQELPAAGAQLPETMGTVSDGCEVSRKGQSPLDQFRAAPSGTSPVGTAGCQQVQSPMAQSSMALAEKGRAFRVIGGQGSVGSTQDLADAGAQLPGPMGTVPDGCEVSRRGLSPLDLFRAASSGTGPVGTAGCQQVQSPMAQSSMALAEKGRAFRVIGGQGSGSGNQEPADAGTQLPETMGTVPDGCEVSRKGLSPLDRLPVSPSGTGNVGTGGCQQVQSPMAQPPKLPVTGCRLPVDSSQSPMAQSERSFMREILMREAMDRGDRQAFEKILHAPDPELETLWRDLLRRDAENGFRFLEKLGLFGDDPPEEEECYEDAVIPDFAAA